MLYQRLVNDFSKQWESCVNTKIVELIGLKNIDGERLNFFLEQNYVFVEYLNQSLNKLTKQEMLLKEREFFLDNKFMLLENSLQYKYETSNLKLSKQTANYINYINYCVASMSILEVFVACTPFIIGYGVVGDLFIASDKIDNKYRNLVDLYVYSVDIKDQFVKLLNSYNVDDVQYMKLSKIFCEVCNFAKHFVNQVFKVSPPIVLSVSWSDSSGCSGVQADVKTISAHGCYAASVVTNVTSQNTIGLNDFYKISPSVIDSQLNAVLLDLNVKAIKIGVLDFEEVVYIILKTINKKIPIVLDLSFVKHKNDFSDFSLNKFKKMFDFVTMITTTNKEAELVTGMLIDSVEDMKEVCKVFEKIGVKNVFIRGEYINDESIYDVLYFAGEFYVYSHRKIDSIHTKGVGCSLSSAIASNLAKGMSLNIAVNTAINYVYDGIRLGYEIGNGKSPINFFHNFQLHYE